MKKVKGGIVRDGLSVAKRERMRGALWRLERDMKKKFPMGRTWQERGIVGSDVSRYERMEREIRTLQNKLGEAELR